jgi:hypothetical protein
MTAVFALLLVFFFFLYFIHLGDKPKSSGRRINLLAIMMGLASSSSLFIFAGSYAQINGYQNRGMSGVWILVSLLLATMYEGAKKITSLLIILIVCTNFIFFCSKVEESIQSARARSKVVEQVGEYFGSNKSSTPVVFLDIPCTFPDGRYKTEVFCTTWDALGAVNALGITISNVSPTGDPAFVANWESREIPKGSLVFWFDNNFSLQKISKAKVADLAFRSDLMLVANRRLFELSEKKNLCKVQAQKIISVNLPFNWSEVVRCASDPFA